MTKLLSDDGMTRYERDGFCFPIRVLSADEALAAHQRATGRVRTYLYKGAENATSRI